jgi:multiple sugar transport system permease protein
MKRGMAIGLTLVVWTMPLVWTALASLGIMPDNSHAPPRWRWSPTGDGYVGIATVDRDLAIEVVMSAGLAAAATLLALSVGLPGAYGLARSSPRSRTWFVHGGLILTSLPVMAYILPLDDTLRRLGLHGTLVGAILAQTAVFASLAMYILSGYVAQVPADLQDAARLEGASTLRVLTGVVLPSTASGLVATGLVLFALNWNLLLVPLVVGAPAVKTLTVGMVDFFTLERGVEWPAAAAALVVSLVPLGLVIGLAHRALEHFSLPTGSPSDL